METTIYIDYPVLISIFLGFILGTLIFFGIMTLKDNDWVLPFLPKKKH